MQGQRWGVGILASGFIDALLTKGSKTNDIATEAGRKIEEIIPVDISDTEGNEGKTIQEKWIEIYEKGREKGFEEGFEQGVRSGALEKGDE